MERTLGEIASHVGGELFGDSATSITGVAGIEEAKRGDLTFLANPRYASFLGTTSASAVIVGSQTEVAGSKVALIRHPNPYLAFTRALELFAEVEKHYPEGIHPTAVLGEGVTTGEGVHLGPHVVAEKGAKLGRNAVVLAGSFIGEGSSIGEGTLIYPNVSIRENVEVGNNVIIHSGTVIGSDGFGFAREKARHHKIPQMGGVKIEDDVEIGANAAIDRATLGVTRIGRGTKIDNLVQIGHNVNIGENCIIVGQVGIGGSSKVGEESVLAGQVGVVGHIKIGKRAVIGAQSGVTKDVPDGATVFGFPARQIHKARRIEAHLSRLDLYVERLKRLEKTLEEIRKKTH